MPAWKALAALVLISLPNRSNVSEKCRFSLRWMVGRSITPRRRTASVSCGPAMPASAMARQVASITRDAAVAHEHVVRLFGQHEAAGAGQRVEAGLRERLELHLA